jgi:hypothetical protein
MLRIVVIAFALTVCSGPVMAEKASAQQASTASRNAKSARVLVEISGWELMADISQTPPIRMRKALWPSA